MDSAYFDELRGRLDGLLIRLQDRFSRRDMALFVEFLDAGEYGLTLEQMADVLSEDSIPISDDERADMLSLEAVMGLGSRVSRPLALCPRLDA